MPSIKKSILKNPAYATDHASSLLWISSRTRSHRKRVRFNPEPTVFLFEIQPDHDPDIPIEPKNEEKLLDTHQKGKIAHRQALQENLLSSHSWGACNCIWENLILLPSKLLVCTFCLLVIIRLLSLWHWLEVCVVQIDCFLYGC